MVKLRWGAQSKRHVPSRPRAQANPAQFRSFATKYRQLCKLSSPKIAHGQAGTGECNTQAAAEEHNREQGSRANSSQQPHDMPQHLPQHRQSTIETFLPEARLRGSMGSWGCASKQQRNSRTWLCWGETRHRKAPSLPAFAERKQAYCFNRA